VNTSSWQQATIALRPTNSKLASATVGYLLGPPGSKLEATQQLGYLHLAAT